MIVSFLVLIVLPAMLGKVFHPPTDSEQYVQILLRWLHFVAGIIWIGHLYFFNLVNVNLMKALDGPTKGKVIPQLMPRVLWWFRWGAVITVLAGLTYYAMYMVAPDAHNADKGVMAVILVWLLLPVLAFGIEFMVIKRVGSGWVLAGVVLVLLLLMSVAIICWIRSALGDHASNMTYSIGIGGALGLVMLLNVWGIIWPNQKRIIAWTSDNAEKGTAIPAESAKLARVAFLASRTNMWASIPMLFFMGVSKHFVVFGI